MFTINPTLAEELAREHAAGIVRNRRRLAEGRAIITNPELSDRRWHHVSEAMAAERELMNHHQQQLHRMNQIRRNARRSV